MSSELDIAAQALKSSSQEAMGSLGANLNQTLKELVEFLVQLREILSERAIPSSTLAVSFRQWDDKFDDWKLNHHSLMTALLTGHDKTLWTKFDDDRVAMSKLASKYT